MDHHRQNNGLLTLMEHWGWMVGVLTALVCSQVLTFFFNLSGQSWIVFFYASLICLFSGAALIVYAKLPAYRSGRFFTFGIKSVPENLAGYYRWGWRIFLFGTVLSLCLSMSKP